MVYLKYILIICLFLITSVSGAAINHNKFDYGDSITQQASQKVDISAIPFNDSYYIIDYMRWYATYQNEFMVRYIVYNPVKKDLRLMSGDFDTFYLNPINLGESHGHLEDKCMTLGCSKIFVLDP